MNHANVAAELTAQLGCQARLHRADHSLAHTTGKRKQLSSEPSFQTQLQSLADSPLSQSTAPVLASCAPQPGPLGTETTSLPPPALNESARRYRSTHTVRGREQQKQRR